MTKKQKVTSITGGEIIRETKKQIHRGMFRPRWETIYRQVEEQVKGYTRTDQQMWFKCKCQSLITIKEVRDHWQNGHFDEPVYQDI